MTATNLLRKIEIPSFLVTGAAGLLGSRILNTIQQRGYPCEGTDIKDADLTQPEDVERVFSRTSPTHVFHCAAYTNVDRAESDSHTARKVNVDATRLVARAAKGCGARLVFLSTDFVFGGRKERPYQPDDEAKPLGAYALSKWEGEEAVRQTLDNHQVVRTAWLFGPDGHNFVRAMVALLESGAEPRVVNDQTGSPTYSVELADRLIDLALIAEATGAWHLTNAGHCSWFEYARQIAVETGRTPDCIHAISTEEWDAPAKRPTCSVLDCSKTYALGVRPMPPWQDSLRHYLRHGL